jgi:hypothetical protein
MSWVGAPELSPRFHSARPQNVQPNTFGCLMGNFYYSGEYDVLIMILPQNLGILPTSVLLNLN